MRSGYLLGLLLTLLVATTASNAWAQSPERALLARVFSASGFIPIEVSRKQSVGDVYRLPDLGLLATQKECFPDLTIESGTDQLRSINVGKDVGLAAGLGIGDIFSLGVNMGTISRVELSFDDVEIARASDVGLRARLSLAACPDLASLIKPYVATDPLPPLIVGEVFTARKRIRIVFRNQQAASASLSFMDRIAKRLGMTTSASASASAGQTSEVEIMMTAGARGAVGLRPAFVPVNRLEGLTMGTGSTAEVRTIRRIEPFKNDLPSHKRAVLEWLEATPR